jgi:hypothetical protein
MAKRYATIAEVRSKLPDSFADPAVTDDEIQGAIDDQACFLGLCAWGECASTGSKYAAAHQILLAHPELPGGGQQGLESGNADGPASRSWAVSPAAASDLWWSSSPCGLMYLELRKPIRGIGSLIIGATSRTARPYG